MPSMGGHENCCGIYVLSSWGAVDERAIKQLDECLERLDAQSKAYKEHGYTKVVQAVLNDTQMEQPWAPILKERGFELVYRFRNTSGRWCNIFYRATHQNALEKVVPDWWQREQKKEESLCRKLQRSTKKVSQAAAGRISSTVSRTTRRKVTATNTKS